MGETFESVKSAVCRVCRIDPAIYGHGRLGKEILPLVRAGVTPEELEAWERWYWRKDWRGRKGDAPTPKVIRETWGQAFAAAPPAPKRPAPPETPPPETPPPDEDDEAAVERALRALPPEELARRLEELRRRLFGGAEGRTMRRWDAAQVESYLRRRAALEMMRGESPREEGVAR